MILSAIGRDTTLSNKAFASDFHSRMLSDKIRMQAYNRTIQLVNLKDRTVLDVGSGTGVLSFLCSQLGAKKVIGIEIQKSAVAVAEKITEKLDVKNAEFHNVHSFDFIEPIEPEVLITETIGCLGIDENMVESCYDLMSRYPSLDVCVPASIKLFVRPIKSDKVRWFFKKNIDGLTGKHFDKFDFECMEFDFRFYAAKQVFSLDYEDITTAGEAIEIASFELGVSSSSKFRYIHGPLNFDYDALNFFFVCDLGFGQSITNSGLENLTHWGKHYIMPPNKQSELIISYNCVNGLNLNWSKGES